MLAIRLQRTGRKGHAMFRVIVQDARRTPTSGKVVAQIGHYDPHTKTIVVSKDKAQYYLEHGAQPSLRLVRLLKAEGVKLPKWVEGEVKKSGATRNPDKMRKNRPPQEAEVKPETAPEPETEKPEAATEKPEVVPEVTESEKPTAEPAADTADKQ